MSELLDKQVNVQKEQIFRGSHKLPQTYKKVCDENETKKKQCVHKNVIHGRSPS